MKKIDIFNYILLAVLLVSCAENANMTGKTEKLSPTSSTFLPTAGMKQTNTIKSTPLATSTRIQLPSQLNTTPTLTIPPTEVNTAPINETSTPFQNAQLTFHCLDVEPVLSPSVDSSGIIVLGSYAS